MREMQWCRRFAAAFLRLFAININIEERAETRAMDEQRMERNGTNEYQISEYWSRRRNFVHLTVNEEESLFVCGWQKIVANIIFLQNLHDAVRLAQCSQLRCNMRRKMKQTKEQD